MNTVNGCGHYKVRQFQRRKDSLALLTHKYVSILKKCVTDYSNASFEKCRVALVCRFSNHMVLCLHGAARKKTNIIIY